MIYTSYFAAYRGNKGVSISNSTPYPMNDRCQELIPSWNLVSAYRNERISWKEYRKQYIKQLKELDVHEVYELLDNKVLLCYEKDDQHCHRSIVREWFNRNGYICRELPKSN